MKKMAELQSDPKQNSHCTSVAVAETRTEEPCIKVHVEEQTATRGRPSSPSPVPPCKLPHSGSPSSSSAQMPDAAEEPMAADGDQEQSRSLEEVVRPEGPSLSPSARRKSWRRLSRRSLPALPNPSKSLCRSISLSLPQQERLEQVMEASMRLAIERTKNSLQSTPNASMESFQKQVDSVQQEWSHVAQSIRREPQCQQPSVASRTPEMLKAMEQTQKSISRLQAESECWDALFNKHRSKADELARAVERGQAGGATLDPTRLAQSSQSELVRTKPDYHALLRRQQPVLHTMELVMDVQCKMVKELLSIQKQSQLLIKETSSRLAVNAGFQDHSPDHHKSTLVNLVKPASAVTLAAGTE